MQAVWDWPGAADDIEREIALAAAMAESCTAICMTIRLDGDRDRGELLTVCAFLAGECGAHAGIARDIIQGYLRRLDAAGQQNGGDTGGDGDA